MHTRAEATANLLLCPCSVNVTVVQDGDFVLITLDNPNFSKKGDWLGLYLASADPTQTAPLKWSYCVPCDYSCCRHDWGL